MVLCQTENIWRFDEHGKSKELIISYARNGFLTCDLATGKSREYLTQEDMYPILYLLAEDRSEVAVLSKDPLQDHLRICNLASGEWQDTRHPMMKYAPGLRLAYDGHTLWAGAWENKLNPAEWSIGKYENGKWTWIAQGRRRPAEHPLDDLVHHGIKNIAKSANGLMQVTFDVRPNANPTTWHDERFEIESGNPLGGIPEAKTKVDFEGGTIEFDENWTHLTATLRKPGVPAEVLLDAVSDELLEKSKPRPARWECPMDLVPKRNTRVYWCNHKGDLYALFAQDDSSGDSYAAVDRLGLYVFRNMVKGPRWIPISFPLPNNGGGSMEGTRGAASPQRFPPTEGGQNGQGLLLAILDDSLLCLPWDDITRWLQSHPEP